MFKQRLFTTLVLAPLVLAVVYLAPPPLFLLLAFLVMLGCGWEFLELIPIQKLGYKWLFMLALLVIAGLFSYFYFMYWLWLSLAVWTAVLLAVLYFPQSQTLWGKPVLVTLCGLLFLPLFAASLHFLHQLKEGKALVVYLLLLVWAADIGAYVAGKQWGSCKLIPKVSPGKTREGFAGGLLLGLLIGLLGFVYFQPHSALKWFSLALLTILISMLGDLFISMLKRRCNLKDTGQLLPGHGGILDRLDSLIAAAPLFYGVYYCLNLGL